MQPLIVAVSGGSGSGKTTLAKGLTEILSKTGTIHHLSQDDYYKDLSHLRPDDRKLVNFDHPDALDHALLVSHIKALRAGQNIMVPSYDFVSHTRVGSLALEAKGIILLEGIFCLCYEDLRPLLDVKFFIDVDCDIRLARRLRRDVLERGRQWDDALWQYQTFVRPMHHQFIEPSKRFADMVLNGESGLHERYPLLVKLLLAT